jgi:DNA-binding MarR family transcriptional regulator
MQMTEAATDRPRDGSRPSPAVADALERIAIGSVGLTTRSLAHADAGFDLTFSQWRAILIVGDRTNGARIGEVAERVGVTLPATSRLLRRLERRGLVGLAPDEHDRRATRARLTDRGTEVRLAILDHRRQAIEQIARSIPEVDTLTLTAGLDALAVEFERYA